MKKYMVRRRIITEDRMVIDARNQSEAIRKAHDTPSQQQVFIRTGPFYARPIQEEGETE